MTTNEYRSRLSRIENEMTGSTVSVLDTYKWYLVISLVTLCALGLYSPPFLYKIEGKKKRQVKKINWVLFASTWLIISIVLSVGYYLYSKSG